MNPKRLRLALAVLMISSAGLGRAAETTEKSGSATCLFYQPKDKVLCIFKDQGFVQEHEIIDDPFFDSFDAAEDNQIFISVNWQEIRGDFYIKNITIGKPSVDHNEDNFIRVLNIWGRLQPDLVPLFTSLEKHAPFTWNTPLRWYKDTPFAYGIAKNNKFFVNFVGRQDAIDNIAQMKDFFDRIKINWYKEIDLIEKAFFEEIKTIKDPKKITELLHSKLIVLKSDFDFNLNCYSPKKTGDSDFNLDFFWGYIPTDFPDETKAKMNRTVGAIQWIIDRTLYEIDNDKEITYVPFHEAKIILCKMGGESGILGDYECIEELKKRFDVAKDIYEYYIFMVADVMTIIEFQCDLIKNKQKK